MRDKLRHFILRRIANYAHGRGLAVVPSETLAALDSLANDFFSYTNKSGYLRNVKTGAGKRCEQRVTRAATLLCGMARYAKRHSEEARAALIVIAIVVAVVFFCIGYLFGFYAGMFHSSR